MATKQRQRRHVGDRRTAIAVTLQRPDGTAENLTGTTVKFEMYDSADGSTKVAETNTGVSVTTPASGECQYDPPAAAVDTPGTYYAYFTVESSSKKDTFPVDEGYLEIIIDPDTSNA
jgi:hypothetical protein